MSTSTSTSPKIACRIRPGSRLVLLIFELRFNVNISVHILYTCVINSTSLLMIDYYNNYTCSTDKYIPTELEMGRSQSSNGRHITQWPSVL